MMPTHREDLIVMRVLVRKGFSFDLAELMLRDLKNVIDALERPQNQNRETFSH